jgi:hypothetical protein
MLDQVLVEALNNSAWTFEFLDSVSLDPADPDDWLCDYLSEAFPLLLGYALKYLSRDATCLRPCEYLRGDDSALSVNPEAPLDVPCDLLALIEL